MEQRRQCLHTQRFFPLDLNPVVKHRYPLNFCFKPFCIHLIPAENCAHLIKQLVLFNDPAPAAVQIDVPVILKDLYDLITDIGDIFLLVAFPYFADLLVSCMFPL